MPEGDEQVESTPSASPGDEGHKEERAAAPAAAPPPTPSAHEVTGELASLLREQREFMKSQAEDAKRTREMTEAIHKAVFEEPEEDEHEGEDALKEGEKEVSIVTPDPPPQPRAVAEDLAQEQPKRKGFLHKIGY